MRIALFHNAGAGSGVQSTPPVNTNQCRRVLFRYVEAPMHVDGEVFLKTETPVAIRTESGALDLLDFADFHS